MTSKTFIKKYYTKLFPKYSKKELIDDCIKFQNGANTLSKVLNHFFKEELWKCKKGKYKYTPFEVIHDSKLLKLILQKIDKHKKFFSVYKELDKKVACCFRNGGYLTQLVTQFPIKTAREIYAKYSKDKKCNILDMSCGFGSRLSACLLFGHNYYGFEPNKNLYRQLQKCVKFYKDNELISSNQIVQINCSGSEIYVPSLKNKIDIAFTSPPYFNLETYSNDKFASTKNIDDYEQWLDNFMRPMLENTTKYLKKGGYLLLNVRNITNNGKYPLYDDCVKICKSIKSLRKTNCKIKVENVSKTFYTRNSTKTVPNSTESILCFIKK